jgi:hypothetical protein
MTEISKGVIASPEKENLLLKKTFFLFGSLGHWILKFGAGLGFGIWKLGFTIHPASGAVPTGYLPTRNSKHYKILW